MSNPTVSTPAASPAPSPATATGRPNRGNCRRYNNQNNNNNNNNNNNTNNSSRFVPKIATIESLVSSSENKGQDFTKFQKSIHHHALTTFKNSKDISKAMSNFAKTNLIYQKSEQKIIYIQALQSLCHDLQQKKTKIQNLQGRQKI